MATRVLVRTFESPGKLANIYPSPTAPQHNPADQYRRFRPVKGKVVSAGLSCFPASIQPPRSSWRYRESSRPALQWYVYLACIYIYIVRTPLMPHTRLIASKIYLEYSIPFIRFSYPFSQSFNRVPSQSISELVSQPVSPPSHLHDPAHPRTQCSSAASS